MPWPLRSPVPDFPSQNPPGLRLSSQRGQGRGHGQADKAAQEAFLDPFHSIPRIPPTHSGPRRVLELAGRHRLPPHKDALPCDAYSSQQPSRCEGRMSGLASRHGTFDPVRCISSRLGPGKASPAPGGLRFRRRPRGPGANEGPGPGPPIRDLSVRTAPPRSRRRPDGPRGHPCPLRFSPESSPSFVSSCTTESGFSPSARTLLPPRSRLCGARNGQMMPS